jgi:hypothetical protein
MSNPSSPIDLGKLFQSVIGTLNENKESLNKADTNNHDHGDNMVNTFELISRAMKDKQGTDPAGQLAYAAEVLSQQKSGSAQLYAKGLSQASQQFTGKQINSDNVMTLIPTLLGVGEAQVRQSAGLMVSPFDGSYVPGKSITFRWKASPEATKYWLTVRRTKDNSGRISICLNLNRLVVDESDRITVGANNVLSVTKLGFMNDGTQYKWNIAVGDNEDSEPADYWTFSNGAPPPRQEPQQQQAQQQQAQQQDAGVSDIIGSLIRQAQHKPQQQPGAGVGDIIGSLIRQGQQKPQQQQGAGVSDIIGSLLRQAQQKPQQKSKSNIEVNQKEIVDALVSNSRVGESYRAQSGSLVANALIAAVQNMVNKK